MVSDIELSIVSTHVYRRRNPNAIDQPSGWTQVGLLVDDSKTGFGAVAYKNAAGDTVIAFSGTEFDTLPDWLQANVPLTFGLYPATQLFQALAFVAESVYEFKRLDPTWTPAQLRLTGHSLGGGLANVIGTYLDVASVGFDTAPFANTVRSELLSSAYLFHFSSVANTIAEQRGLGPLTELVTPFNQYVAELIAVPVIDPPVFIERREKSRNVFVQGEVLEGARASGLYSAIVGTAARSDVDEVLGLVYDARVKLQATSLRVERRDVALSPGMAASVEIKAGTRRLIDYFLSPIQSHVDESLGER